MSECVFWINESALGEIDEKVLTLGVERCRVTLQPRSHERLSHTFTIWGKDDGKNGRDKTTHTETQWTHNNSHCSLVNIYFYPHRTHINLLDTPSFSMDPITRLRKSWTWSSLFTIFRSSVKSFRQRKAMMSYKKKKQPQTTQGSPMNVLQPITMSFENSLDTFIT